MDSTAGRQIRNGRNRGSEKKNKAIGRGEDWQKPGQLRVNFKKK